MAFEPEIFVVLPVADPSIIMASMIIPAKIALDSTNFEGAPSMDVLGHTVPYTDGRGMHALDYTSTLKLPSTTEGDIRPQILHRLCMANIGEFVCCDRFGNPPPMIPEVILAGSPINGGDCNSDLRYHIRDDKRANYWIMSANQPREVYDDVVYLDIVANVVSGADLCKQLDDGKLCGLRSPFLIYPGNKLSLVDPECAYISHVA